MNFKQKELKNKILESIKSGKVKMRSRYYFLARGLIYAAAGILVALALVYLVSFIFFILKVQGAWYLPAFGFSGFGKFLISFPWILALAGFVFILALELLMKKIQIVYQKPLFYSVLILIILVLLVGFVFAKLPFHQNIFEKAREDEVPILGPLYRGYGHKEISDMYHGQVMEINGDYFNLKTITGSEFVVRIDSMTKKPKYRDLTVGDNLIVVGEKDDNQIEAVAIKILPPGSSYFPKRPPQRLEMFPENSLKNYFFRP